tara:strand:- start:2317 stop:3462 length:1146 start_codon:yes stop_codon:yes gene_type:complete
MTTNDNIKNIRWVFIACILLAVFARATYQKTSFDLYLQFEFERYVLSSVFLEGKDLEKLTMYPFREFTASDSRKLKFLIDKNNQEFNLKDLGIDSDILEPSSFTYKDLREIDFKYEDLKNNGFRFALELDDHFGTYGDIYFIDGVPKNVQAHDYIGDRLEFTSNVLIISNFLRNFYLVAECSFVTSSHSEKGHINCVPLIGHSSSLINFSGQTSPLYSDKTFNKDDYIENFKKIYDFSRSRATPPLINVELPVIEIWFAIFLTATFLQVYALVNLRNIADAKLKLEGWLFVSWIYNINKNFIDSLTNKLTMISGIFAYFALTFLPCYIVWNASKLRKVFDTELLFWDPITIVSLITSALLSFLLAYYLVVIFLFQYREFHK